MELRKLTGVDEELIGNSRVIHIMDGAGKQSGEDLQISKHSLGQRKKAGTVNIYVCVCGCSTGQDMYYCFDLIMTKFYLLFLLDELEFTSRAGVDSKTCVDWTTSAAWMLLW